MRWKATGKGRVNRERKRKRGRKERGRRSYTYLMKLEINMHHLRDNAIPAGPLSKFDEILCRLWIKSVLLSKISTLWA